MIKEPYLLEKITYLSKYQEFHETLVTVDRKNLHEEKKIEAKNNVIFL